jgi:hypothetical protein
MDGRALSNRVRWCVPRLFCLALCAACYERPPALQQSNQAQGGGAEMSVDAGSAGTGLPADAGSTPVNGSGAGGAANATCFDGSYPAQELCNGSDDDCDGQVDETFDLDRDPNNCGACGAICNLANADSYCSKGTCAVARCAIGFSDADGLPENGCERGECIRQLVPIEAATSIRNAPGEQCEAPHDCRVENGELVFGFCLDSCTVAWEGCQLAAGTLSDFERQLDDAVDHLLQIDFCVESGTITAPINLWFGGDAAQKKWLPLVAPGEQLVANECYQRIFERRQAKTADATATLACGCIDEGAPPECQVARADNLRVIAEWCDELQSHGGRIRVTSIQTLTGSCRCSDQPLSPCVEPGVTCRPLDRGDCPASPDVVAGCVTDSCGGVPRPGSACDVGFDGPYCQGTIVCIGGKKSCVCDPAVGAD